MYRPLPQLAPAATRTFTPASVGETAVVVTSDGDRAQTPLPLESERAGAERPVLPMPQPLGSPVHTDPAASQIPASSAPRGRVKSPLFAISSAPRRSYRSLPGSTVEEASGVRRKAPEVAADLLRPPSGAAAAQAPAAGGRASDAPSGCRSSASSLAGRACGARPSRTVASVRGTLSLSAYSVSAPGLAHRPRSPSVASALAGLSLMVRLARASAR